MTVYIPFTPISNGTPPWSGQMMLDGVAYNAVVTWNIYGQRYYLSLAQQNQQPIWYGPLVGSPLNADILLAFGIFQISTLLYRADTAQFEVGP